MTLLLIFPVPKDQSALPYRLKAGMSSSREKLPTNSSGIAGPFTASLEQPPSMLLVTGLF